MNHRAPGIIPDYMDEIKQSRFRHLEQDRFTGDEYDLEQLLDFERKGGFRSKVHPNYKRMKQLADRTGFKISRDGDIDILGRKIYKSHLPVEDIDTVKNKIDLRGRLEEHSNSHIIEINPFINGLDITLLYFTSSDGSLLLNGICTKNSEGYNIVVNKWRDNREVIQGIPERIGLNTASIYRYLGLVTDGRLEINGRVYMPTRTRGNRTKNIGMISDIIKTSAIASHRKRGLKFAVNSISSPNKTVFLPQVIDMTPGLRNATDETEVGGRISNSCRLMDLTFEIDRIIRASVLGLDFVRISIKKEDKIGVYELIDRFDYMV